MGGVMTMKKMWNNLNIATKLILVFSMVSVMPLLVMSFVLYHISANSLESTMEETASIFSSQIASDMNGFISDYDALTKSLLVNEGLMDRLDTEIPISQRIENKLFYRELVMRLMTMESEIQSVTIMNEEGGYFQYDRTGRSLSYEELLRQDWFLKEQENSEVLFLTPLHDCSYYDRNRDQIEAALVSGTLPQDSHSIALDMEYAEDMIGVEAGSVIKLSIGDQEIPVTVSGLFLNDGLQNGHGPLALDNTCMVATKELFQEAMPMIDCFDYSWSIVSDPQKAEQIENSLSAIISSDPDLALDTIGIHKDYKEMENRVVFGGFQALSWLVFLFGVVNLINTTLSNQISRKRENSVFRAIGLTRKQLCQMTIYEGICYAFFAALATLAAGLPIAVIAARKFSEMTFHGVIMPYSFPFLQMGLFVLVLFGLEVILSFWTMRRQKNQSLVEEMRAME